MAILFALSFPDAAFSQPLPPPPPKAGHGASGNAQEGGAPIGEGIWILITLALNYCVYQYMCKNENTADQQNTDGISTTDNQ